MKARKPSNLKPLASLFRALGQPARLRILFALGGREACVCHLEAALKLRQAYLSQQLMVLREAGLVDARREGKNVYYRLVDPSLLEWLQGSARLAAGLEEPEQEVLFTPLPDILPGCPCPKCSPDLGTEAVISPERVAVQN